MVKNNNRRKRNNGNTARKKASNPKNKGKKSPIKGFARTKEAARIQNAAILKQPSDLLKILKEENGNGSYHEDSIAGNISDLGERGFLDAASDNFGEHSRMLQSNVLDITREWSKESVLERASEICFQAVIHDLPFVNEMVTVGGNSMSKLCAAYLASIFDVIGHMRGDISEIQRDLEKNLLFKRAIMMSDYMHGDTHVVATYKDIDGEIQDIFGPISVVVGGASLGWLVDLPGTGEGLQYDGTITATDANILGECMAHYAELVNLLAGQGHVVVFYQLRTKFDNNISAFAVPVENPLTNLNSSFYKVHSFSLEMHIPVNERWLAASTVVKPTPNIGEQYLPVRFTWWHSSAHFANYLTEKDSRIPLVLTTLVDVQDIYRQFILALIEADQLQTEEKDKQDYDSVWSLSSNSIFNGMNMQEINLYIINLLSSRMTRPNNLTKTQLPQGWNPLSGTNFACTNLLLEGMGPAFISERLALLNASCLPWNGGRIKYVPTIVSRDSFSVHYNGAADTNLNAYGNVSHPITGYVIDNVHAITPTDYSRAWTKIRDNATIKRNVGDAIASVQDSCMMAPFLDSVPEANLNGYTLLISTYQQARIVRESRDKAFTRPVYEFESGAGIIPFLVMASGDVDLDVVQGRCRSMQELIGHSYTLTGSKFAQLDADYIGPLMVQRFCYQVRNFMIQKYSSPRTSLAIALEVVYARGDGGNLLLGLRNWFRKNGRKLIVKLTPVAKSLTEAFLPGKGQITEDIMNKIANLFPESIADTSKFSKRVAKARLSLRKSENLKLKLEKLNGISSSKK